MEKTKNQQKQDKHENIEEKDINASHHIKQDDIKPDHIKQKINDQNVQDAEGTAEMNQDSVQNSDLAIQLDEAKDQIAQLEGQLKDQKLRAFAEEQNIRRRASADVEKAHKYGQESFIKELLPIVDSLEQALLSAKTHKDQEQDKAQDQLLSSMIEGIELTMKMLLDSFGKFDIASLDPEGQAFNPQEHEAMAMQPSDKVEANTVIQVMQKGYKLHDRVLRPARVIVSR